MWSGRKLNEYLNLLAGDENPPKHEVEYILWIYEYRYV